MPLTKFAAIVAIASTLFAAACNRRLPKAVDAEMAACVPPGANLLAGIHLDRLRASNILQLFPSIQPFVESFQGASSLMVASKGVDYLMISRGSFREAPAGSTLLAGGLAVSGTTAWVQMAQSRHRDSGGAVSPLLEHAEPIAAASDIWMVVAGQANLPVTGNGENLNRLLSTTQYSIWTARISDRIAIKIQAVCAVPDAARHLEETTRAFLTFGAAATLRQPQLSVLLKRVQIRRDDRTVHFTLTADPADLNLLLKP